MKDQINAEPLIATFGQTMDELISLFATFSPQEVNTVPYDKSWTPGQMAAHVVKVTTGFNDMLNGPVEDTHRQPDMQSAQIKNDFLNYSIHMEAPEFVRPEIKDYDKEELLSLLWEATGKVLDSAGKLDMNQTCTSFKPGDEWFTRYEALTFVTYHNQRHIWQLRRMEKALKL